MVSAYENRGLTLVLQGKDLDAERDFVRALAIKPAIKAELDERIKVAKALRVSK
jgi:Tfp pilus assembly protein PilF